MLPIYSLFAAKAGASRVVAVDGSAKMASVATQVCLFSLQYCIKIRTSLHHEYRIGIA
jgi:hypothetical protein